MENCPSSVGEAAVGRTGGADRHVLVAAAALVAPAAGVVALTEARTQNAPAVPFVVEVVGLRGRQRE